MNRTYKMKKPLAGLTGTVISDYVDDRQETAVLWLPDGTGPETLMGVTDALQHALQQGRADRSEEILGDAGLGRAAAELNKHEAGLHMSGVWCSCGRYHDESATTEKWERHLVYEVLQAAARTT